MKRLSVLITILSVAFSVNLNAMSVSRDQDEMTASVAEQLLDKQLVLVKNKDNSIGVVAESVDDFPAIADDNIYEGENASAKSNKDNLLILPTTEQPEQASTISLDGVSTRIVLADFQRKCLEILRHNGKNPKAIFKADSQIVVTPDGKEAYVDVKLARWKVK